MLSCFMTCLLGKWVLVYLNTVSFFIYLFLIAWLELSFSLKNKISTGSFKAWGSDKAIKRSFIRHGQQ